MSPIIWLISTVLFVYMWIILAMVILSWLTSFGVVNGSNPTVRQIRYALFRLTEPVLGPIWVWLVHGEVPSGRTLLGGAVVVTALLLHLLWQFRGPTSSKAVGLSV